MKNGEGIETRKTEDLFSKLNEWLGKSIVFCRNTLGSNWNFRRLFYLLAGTGMVVISIADRQWFGIAFGIYFASMGLFAFGCASGQCGGGACMQDNLPEKNAEIQNNNV